ncbi:MAG: PglZ domain-containing protein [Bacteroidetes bacterium]|nr:PglZ domain-containing protein [Bacteroidota bacterium]
MKLKVVLDKTKLITDSTSNIFEQETDYFKAFGFIKKKLKEKRDLRVIVHNYSLYNWLLKGFSKYDFLELESEEINYKELLAKKWNIEYDINISDADILESKLLEMSLEGESKLKFSDFIFEHFISTNLKIDIFSKVKFGELLNDLIQFDKQKNKLPEIIQRVYDQRIRIIIQNNNNIKILELLGKDIQEAYEMSCIYKIVSGYSTRIKLNCLTTEWLEYFDEEKLNLAKLDVSEFIKHSQNYKSKVVAELSIYYNNIFIENTEEVKDLINHSSGIIKEEINYILEILRNQPVFITNEIITIIRSKFKSILSLYGQDIEELKEYIPAPVPGAFNSNWNIDQVIDWAINEYLPYKFWMDRTKKYDEEILAYGSGFSDYIYNNYDKISYHYNNLAHRFLFNLKDIIKETDVVVLLVLDNFNYRFFQALKSSLKKYQFVIKNEDPYLTLLPTETGISKISIISGFRDKMDNKGLSYEKSLMENWKEYFPDHKITYTSKIGSLNDYEASGKEIILVNYLELDKELHRSFEKTAIEHQETIRFLINGITKAIDKFNKANSLENKIRIFFISDHGSVIINKEIKNELDIKYFKEYKIDPSHRFLRLDEKEYKNFKENVNISDGIYFLDKEISGDGTNYILARGYNRFIDISEEFYVHGGALPEEVIVPGGYFEYQYGAHKLPIIQLKKTDYRYLVKDNIRLRIANPNELPLEDIVIEVSGNEGIFTQIILDKIGPNGEMNIERPIRIEEKDLKELQINLSYRIINESNEFIVKFPIKLKTIVENKFDFEDF